MDNFIATHLQKLYFNTHAEFFDPAAYQNSNSECDRKQCKSPFFFIKLQNALEIEYVLFTA